MVLQCTIPYCSIYNSNSSSLVISDGCILLVDAVPTTAGGGFVRERSTSCDDIITVLVESEQKQDTGGRCQLWCTRNIILAALSENKLLREKTSLQTFGDGVLSDISDVVGSRDSVVVSTDDIGSWISSQCNCRLYTTGEHGKWTAGWLSLNWWLRRLGRQAVEIASLVESSEFELSSRSLVRHIIWRSIGGVTISSVADLVMLVQSDDCPVYDISEIDIMLGRQ